MREPVDMPWGERVAFVADPEGNLVSLASAAAGAGQPPKRERSASTLDT